MKKNENRKVNDADPAELDDSTVPESRYFKDKTKFDESVALDFIEHANKATEKGETYLVGLSHGKSPAGVYKYLLEHYRDLWHPDRIRYTFVNSKLKSQRSVAGVTDATEFLKQLLRTERIKKDQIIGRNLDRENIEVYTQGLNEHLTTYLKKAKKSGLDFVFLACNPAGQVAGISRNSTAFASTDIAVVVEDEKNEKEITFTPSFLNKSGRIAFLATKADKRRPLAWLFYRWAKKNESPGFLRFMENVPQRMTVYIDDKALTWPQVEVERETRYGPTTIRVDMAKPYEENAKKKLPVILFIHGFMGLNTFDGLLAAIPSRKYIAAAMHYGTIPNDLPPVQYSQFVVYNIDAVVAYFGSRGHSVYIFDHSMANIYFLMADRAFDKLEGMQKYLCGRIGANPFFGSEAKHALLGFLDDVILPSKLGVAERAMFTAARSIIPWDSKRSVRRRGINLTEWLIGVDSSMRENIWKSTKARILFMMTNLDSLPHLNRIPIEQALNRLPAKVFAIQIHSGLEASKSFDDETSMMNMPLHNIPVLILKSNRDGVAKYVPGVYEGSELTEVVDITTKEETDLFREHLYHMIHPQNTTRIIEKFIQKAEQLRQEKKLVAVN
jgi:6-phosphogluconolactonase/glucosamine-6-phosphate isomerase/deaminase